MNLSVQLRMLLWKGPNKYWGTLVHPKIPFLVTTFATRGFADSQAALPHLPVPPLDKTLQKYLGTVKPLVTDEEFGATRDIVKKFGSSDGVGQKLQDLLLDRAKAKANWLEEWWLNTAYLEFRWPVVVWSSPGLVFPTKKFRTLDDQLNYAALVIAGALDYKSLVDRKEIPVDMMGKNPLDMAQYFMIFGNCRIPGITGDSLLHHGQTDSTHVAVAHNNHFFRLDILGKNGKPLHYRQIADQLRNIVERSTHATHPVGILSSQNRNVWGKAYKQLRKDKMNRASINEIQRALFLVCLDGPINNPTGCKQTDAGLVCVHGNDVNGNSGNRWFDKTIQFIISKKGEVGLTYEHSPAEGPPLSILMDHIENFVNKAPQDAEVPFQNTSKPKRLMFDVSSHIKSEIENAKVALQSLIDDLEMTCFTFKEFGKNFIKSHKLSPDSFIQIAIQFAFYRIHKEPGAHYETASTRMYLHGRTETIRSCSLESVSFAHTMLNPDASNQQKANTLKAAINSHKQYVSDAVQGYGVDRHLLGLKLAAIECGMDVPDLFMDVSYIRSSHMRISSSQVPAKCEGFMCYGPLVPDGYACCYNPRSDSIVIGASAFNSSPETHSTIFREALEKSLIDMRDVLVQDCVKAKL